MDQTYDVRGAGGRIVAVTRLLPALHMGSLHPFEQALTLVLAFGPFVLLAAVIWWRRREDG